MQQAPPIGELWVSDKLKDVIDARIGYCIMILWKSY